MKKPLQALPQIDEASTTDTLWKTLEELSLDPAFLTANGLFPKSTESSTTSHFDMIRTRILQPMQKRGWRRLVVTSPTYGCGKTTVAANLALSLARRPSGRTVLLDMELRSPGLAARFGVQGTGALRDFLCGPKSLEAHFRRIGETLILGLNDKPEAAASEILQEPSTARALETMTQVLDPEIVIMDAGPALMSDDVLALTRLADAALMIVDGTQSSPRDIRACEKLLEGNLPLLGVVLNRAQDRGLSRYQSTRKR